MADKKVYQIQINGIKESVNAIESLNKVLDELDKRIKELEKKNINVNTNSNAGGGTSQTHTTVTSEEEKLAQQIAAIDAKREAYSKEIYQNYLAAKDVLDETLKDQKAIAAAERVQSNTYGNTIAGMKSKLADLKGLRETTDIASEEFKKLNTEINDLTRQLKELDSEANSNNSGLGKITVMVGNVAREYKNYRQAIKELKAERFELANTLGQEAEAYKEIDEAVKKLESDYNDLNKSSAFMDNLLDTMQSFTAIASATQGLSALFGIDDSEIQRSIQRLVALQNVLKGIETIQLQMQKKEGLGKWLAGGSKSIDNFVSKLTGAKREVDGLTMSTKAGTVAVRGLSAALKGIVGIIGLIGFMALSAAIEKIAKDADTAKIRLDALTMSLNSLNKAYEERVDNLTSSYIKKELSDNEYLSDLYAEQGKHLKENIDLINKMQKAMNSKGFLDYLSPSYWMNLQNTGYTGTRISGDGSKSMIDAFWDIEPDYSKLFKTVDEAEKEFEKLNKAIDENEDYISKYGNTILKAKDFLLSLIMTVGDTRDAMIGVGNAIASDYNARLMDAMDKLAEAQRKVAKGVAGADQEVKTIMTSIRELYKEMNSSEAYKSFLANMDKYIPDEKVREAIQNMIDVFKDFNNSADESTTEWASFWARKRIDKMKEGKDKALALIELERRETIAKYGDTQEHINDINAAYARKRYETEKQYAKEYNNALADLKTMQIQTMKDGWDKQKKQLDLERSERIRKIVEEDILVEKRVAAVNALYDKKILDAKKKWAEDVLNVYRNLRDNIDKFNEQTYDTEVSTANQKVDNRATSQKQAAGKSTITTTNFDDTKTLEEYYKKVLDIEEQAAHRLAEIRNEKLRNDLAYNKKEEELRHERVTNSENGELAKQYEAGKITKEQYDQLLEDENAAHYARMKALDEEYAASLEKSTHDELEAVQSQYNQYYGNIITETEKAKQEIDAKMAKQPKVDKAGWGVVMAVSVKKQYREALAQYDDLKKQVEKKQQELNADLQAGRISPEDFAMRQSELKKEVQAIDDAVLAVKEKQKMLVADFIQSIQMYIDAAVDSFQTIMQALWDAEDARFDKEQEEIDKENEMLDNKLNEQEQLVEQHKSKIDSLEDELANSRGSRRQHLIDQINAEMAAERAAAKQQQKLQKDKEKQQAKQDALDKKRKKAQYKRDMLQAIVNGAMAVTFAAMNAWPVPAIPMMALAAATTAAEIAIMAANKPYAKGGQLEGGQIVGNRHRDGGVKVLGGRAEVEGGEYITNRITTQKNIDILDYINGKHKRLTLDDFVDFYGGSKVRNSIISSTPKRMFEEGGVLPTLRNDYDINDSMLSALEYYNNRPVVVSVVDIIDKEVDVKRVQTLAGL